MNVEEKSKQLIEAFTSKLKAAASESIDEFYTDALPHAEYDIELNVQFRTEDVIKNLIAGKFRYEDNCFVVEDSNGMSVRVGISNYEYDNIRKSLISVMPKCPKDLEIESLNNRIEQMYKDRF